jgi:hypothetical protein
MLIGNQLVQFKGVPIAEFWYENPACNGTLGTMNWMPSYETISYVTNVGWFLTWWSKL